MNDFLELARIRQSCRDFADKAIEHDKLVACVEAARLAPSGCNSQPWSFVVVESPELVAKIANCIAMNGVNPYAKQAKAFVIVLEEYARLFPQIASIYDSQIFAKGDVGAATAYLCLEAASQGLATCQFGVFDRPGIRESLGIPEYKSFGAVIGFGYPAKAEIREKQRKSLDEIASFR